MNEPSQNQPAEPKTESAITSAPVKKRIFKYDGREFQDPGSHYSNEEVRDSLRVYYPELASAEIEVKELNADTQEILFEKVAGTKGGSAEPCLRCGNGL